MFLPAISRPAGVAVIFFMAASLLCARADSWGAWTAVPVNGIGAAGVKLATDGTNMYFSTYLSGVYRAAVADGNFSAMPMTGFPLWDANVNSNGFAVANIAATPQGTIVISGSQVSANSTNITFNPPGSASNTVPVFYWWDETNQLWQAAAVSGKTYPYTANVGNFSIAPDGSLWTCSGFASYAYRSRDGGHSYTAFDVNAGVPANYFPMPITGQTTFGEVFSLVAGWNNEVVIGTETGGYLHTTNNGLAWRSLDPNYTNTASTNPLGRTGDARVAGVDHYGNFLCDNFQMSVGPAQTNWGTVKLIGWRPKDGLVFNAANGIAAGLAPASVVTMPSGMTYGSLSQGTNGLGGIYRTFDGKNWNQFNNNLPTVSPNVGNALAAGNSITTVGNVVYAAQGNVIYEFDTTPPPPDRTPVARAQSQGVWKNSATNLTLIGYDADGDGLNFTITQFPVNGLLSGNLPYLTYTPSNGFTGLDAFQFVVDDGTQTSVPASVTLAVDNTNNAPPVITLASQPADGGACVVPANITLTATASANNGLSRVIFCEGTNQLTVLSNSPFAFTVTNPSAGDHVYIARAERFEGRTWSQPVSISVLPLVPRLSIKPADPQNIAVTWPLELDGFYVESAADAVGPWTLVPYSQVYTTSGQTATVPMADRQFFRLMHPH